MKGEILYRGQNKEKLHVYQIRIFKGMKEGEDGKQVKDYHYKTVKLKKPSQKEVEIIRNAEMNKFHKGEIRESSETTVSEYIDQWLEVSLKNSVEMRTYYDYKMHSTRYIKKEIGNIRLDKLAPEMIQKFYNGMTARGLSARTVRYTHAVLRRALRQAVIWKRLQQNPAEFVDLPKGRKREMKVLSPQQAEKFLEAAANDPYYALWMVALDGGLSPEEYFGLQWQDYYGGALHIQRALCRNSFNNSFYFKEPKAEKRRRRVPLSQATIEALDAHRRQQLEWKLKRGEKYENPHNLIFTTPAGTPLHLSNMRRKHFKVILKNAELPEDFRMYDLRHSMATMALLENVHAKKVQDRLGHSTYQLTMDTYSHILPEMQEEVSEALDNVLFSKFSKTRKKKKPRTERTR